MSTIGLAVCDNTGASETDMRTDINIGLCIHEGNADAR